MDKAQAIRNLIAAAKNRYISVKFVKRNGEERVISFNPSHHLETKGTGSPRPDVITVVDSSKTKWRSFRAESVLSIESKGEVHVFN